MLGSRVRWARRPLRQYMNDGVGVCKRVGLRTVCALSNVNDAVHVEAERELSTGVARWRAWQKYTPHNFIRNCAHLVGEAILVPTVLLRGDGYGTGRVSDVLSYCVPVWIADLHETW